MHRIMVFLTVGSSWGWGGVWGESSSHLERGQGRVPGFSRPVAELCYGCA